MTTWTYAGIDLETFGHITDLDDYLDTVSKRGGNQTLPFKNGALYVEKYFDETTISVGIAISKDSAIELEQTLDDMKELFSGGEKELINTRADGSTRTAMAAVEGKFQTKRESYKFCRAVVVFKMANPFFRGSVEVDETVIVDDAVVTLLLDNVGTVFEDAPDIVLEGPLEDVVITNPANGYILQYNAPILSPRVVTITTLEGEFTATDDLGASVIGNVEHTGGPTLMKLETGINDLQITSTVQTTGTVRVHFYPPYL